jgi:hypothetical protein
MGKLIALMGVALAGTLAMAAPAVAQEAHDSVPPAVLLPAAPEVPTLDVTYYAVVVAPRVAALPPVPASPTFALDSASYEDYMVEMLPPAPPVPTEVPPVYFADAR